MQISLIFEWLVSVADSIVYAIVIFFLIIFVLITSLFEDENSIYCESFDSPMQLCETSDNDLPKASSFN
jgi:hypothetical protein|nr:hypothetical protein [Pelagibacteraceae bacterium]|tara:strand:+ start:260 stop:466 length:207 start_codon:yes stop_codon:yes gene_type:complete